MDTSFIGVLSTLFWICLSFTILFFIISVILFFVFDIRTIFNFRTGRARAKAVKEMSAANENTGRLRIDGKTQTSKLSDKDKRKGRAPAVIPPSPETKNLYYSGGEEETQLLKNEASAAAEETQQLYQPAGNTVYAETTVLSNAFDPHTEEVAPAEEPAIGFRVIKKVLMIHTEEVIS